MSPDWIVRHLNRRAALVCSLALFAASAGCSSPAPAPTTMDCPASLCGGHGACTALDYTVTCVCEMGYSGDTCLTCASGYHRSGDLCVADVKCAADSCGSHGTCSDANGTPACACADGYAGPTCASCSAGFVDYADAGCAIPLKCAALSCSGHGACDDGSGAVACTCDAAYQGLACESCVAGYHRDAQWACVADVKCAASACSGHGTCDDGAGTPSCTCDAGYTGSDCADCYAGYHADATDGGSACVLDLECSPTSCSGAGVCNSTGSAVSCACDAGYQGTACDHCDTGYHRDVHDRCVADALCAASSQCSVHSTCDDSSGVVSCLCDTGYTGATCSDCYPGYHDDGAGACAPDDKCGETSCTYHGACEDATGAIACTCDPGFEGDRCQTNTDDCVNTACNGGRCIDLVNDHICLCPDGSYGPTCPDADAGTSSDGSVVTISPDAGASDDGGLVTTPPDAGTSD